MTANRSVITGGIGRTATAGKTATAGQVGQPDKNQQADILNVGRTARIANPQQRRAVTTRQHGICANPGCTNPHLEIHHITWWSSGGATDLDNLVGLCSRCHHLVHRDLLHITQRNGQIHIGRQRDRQLNVA